ncbi:MAG: hypothetical protein ACP5FL_06275, partial [Thermoplasmatota archaeon]
MDYNSTRDDAGVSWTLSTNASFLSNGKWNGTVWGTPSVWDIGTWWVNVTVHYGAFFDSHNFSLNVLAPPITVCVDDNYDDSTPGWQYDHFDVIQDGIDAVAENGTVYVANGTYYENVIVNKTIDLIGEDRNGTIIDGGGNGNVVFTSVDWVNISDFYICNSGQTWT